MLKLANVFSSRYSLYIHTLIMFEQWIGARLWNLLFWYCIICWKYLLLTSQLYKCKVIASFTVTLHKGHVGWDNAFSYSVQFRVCSHKSWIDCFLLQKRQIGSVLSNFSSGGGNFFDVSVSNTDFTVVFIIDAIVLAVKLKYYWQGAQYEFTNVFFYFLKFIMLTNYWLLNRPKRKRKGEGNKIPKWHL